MIKRYLFIAKVTTFLLLLSNLASAQEFNYKVNAMYVYYFTKYIDWPSHSDSDNITIGVLGDSPVSDQLRIIIANKKSDTRTIIIKRIDISEINKCQIIVVSKSKSSSMRQVQEAAKDLSILIVTEKPGLINKGAGICIYIDDEDNFKTKFEISKKNLQNHELKVATELLEMAEIVN